MSEASQPRIRTFGGADELIVRATNKRLTRSDNDPEKSLAETAKKLDDLRYADHQLDHRLKKHFGIWAIILLVAQMIVTNVGCIWYGVVVSKGGEEVPTEALIAWMSSTIVEIVALAVIVAKYLFPDSGNNWNQEPERASRE